MAMARKSKPKPAKKTALKSIKIHPEVYRKIEALKSHPRESFNETLNRLAIIAEKLLKLREHPRELPEDVLNRLLQEPKKEPQTATREDSSREAGFIA